MTDKNSDTASVTVVEADSATEKNASYNDIEPNEENGKKTEETKDDLKINEFDFITFINLVRRKKKRIFWNAVIAAFLGVFIAFSIPKEYSSSITLAPEMQDGSQMGGMSSLAAAAGINIGQGTDAIVPSLYPDVVSSNTFLVDLMDTKVHNIDGDVHTVYSDFVKNHTKRTWWSWIKVGFGKMMKAIFPPKDFGASNADGSINPAMLSNEDFMLVEGMRNSIVCSVDELSGVVTLKVICQDPMVALIMVDTVKNHLQEFITEYRTSKAREDYRYYTGLLGDARKKYDDTQLAYARYTDTHRNTLLQAYISEQEKLESEMQMAMENYQGIQKQAQLALAKVQEKTPAFTVLEAASIAHRADSPKKLLILMAFVFVSVVGTLAWLYIKLLFNKKTAEA